MAQNKLVELESNQNITETISVNGSVNESQTQVDQNMAVTEHKTLEKQSELVSTTEIMVLDDDEEEDNVHVKPIEGKSEERKEKEQVLNSKEEE